MFGYNDEAPPCPDVKIRITDQKRGLTFDYDAIVDTGSDATCIPRDIVNPIRDAGKISYQRCYIQDPETGYREPEEMIRITTALVELIDKSGRVLYADYHSDFQLVVRQEGIIGRNFLNLHRCFFHGQRLQWALGKCREG